MQILSGNRSIAPFAGWVFTLMIGGISGYAVARWKWFAVPLVLGLWALCWFLMRVFGVRKQIQDKTGQALADFLPAIVWSINIESICDYTNHYWHEYSGLRTEETSYGGWRKVIPPEDYARVLAIWERSKIENKPFEFDCRVRRNADGQFRWHHGKFVPELDSSNRVVRWACTAIDIHDLRHSEEAFRMAAEAGERLAGSLDLATTLRTVLELGIPRLADWGYAYLIDRESAHPEYAVSHVDPNQLALVEKILDNCRIGIETPGNATHILKWGESMILELISKDSLNSVPLFEETRLALLMLNTQSLISVPLIVEGQTRGVLTYATSDSGRRLGLDDLKLTQDIARRASLAVENSRLYREATESLALLDTLVGSAPVGFCFLDQELRYRRINETLAEINGLSAQEHIGRTIDEILPDWMVDKIENNLQRVLMGEAVFGIELSGPSSTRSAEPFIHTLSSYYPVRSPEGKTLGVGIIVVNITDLKQTEIELAAAKEAAETANRSKDRFLAILSHELRTPLTPVLAAVDGLLDVRGATTRVPRETLEMIRRNIGLEARLINDLLDVTRIGRGQIALDLEPLNIHDLVHQAVEICQSHLNRANHNLVLELEATHSTVQADRVRLLQVIWNLIKNAVKFTQDYGNIHIMTRNSSNKIVIHVEDDGIGISADSLPRIFDFFVQGANLDAGNRTGLGIGLAISRWVMTAHGGILEASSAGPGQGARFTVELETIVDQVDSHENDPVQTINTTAKRLLIVDSNEDTREVIGVALRRWGYDVETACGVEQALELGLTHSFDLMIGDIELSDGSGFDLMARLKAERGLIGIALSGYADDVDLARSREVGFVEYLLKPSDFGRLVAAINRVLESRRTT